MNKTEVEAIQIQCMDVYTAWIVALLPHSNSTWKSDFICVALNNFCRWYLEEFLACNTFILTKRWTSRLGICFGILWGSVQISMLGSQSVIEAFVFDLTTSSQFNFDELKFWALSRAINKLERGIGSRRSKWFRSAWSSYWFPLILENLFEPTRFLGL